MYDFCRHAHTQHVHVHAQIMQHRRTKELSCDRDNQEPPRGRGSRRVSSASQFELEQFDMYVIATATR